MNVWAIVLYAMGAFTLLGVSDGLSQAKKGPIKFGTGAGVFGLLVAALGFFAIYKLTMQSSAEHAKALGITYAVISALALPSFFAAWARGSVTYTPRRALLVSISEIAGIVLVTILAFAS
jgi:hypothetical protein